MLVGASTNVCVRRCPTLPHPPGCSTIGAVGLSFRVRDGTGRFPHAMTAVTLCPPPRPLGVGGEICGYNMFAAACGRRCGVVILLSVPVQQCRGGGFVGWEPHSGRKQSCFFVPPLGANAFESVCGVVCGVSYRPISTGQLHESLVLASTSGLSTQWSGWGPLTHKVYGNLISKRASRLDAFSGYPIRT